MVNALSEFKGNLSLLSDFSIANLVEVAIISFLLYKILIFLRNSRAFTVLKGVVVVFVFAFLASVFHLDNILWILEKVSATAVIALVVIFQPELRKAMETIGKQRFVAKFVNINETDEENALSQKTLDELTKGVFAMAKVKTGALIVLKEEEDLSQYIETGIRVDGIITAALLINTFEKNTPLHDGAVIIEKNRLVAATCYLPLSENEEISKDLGTRHRAAIGMSEATDAVVIVVSEETGHVSVAREGALTKVTGADHFKQVLRGVTVPEPAEQTGRKRRNKKKAKEAENNDKA